VAGEHNKRENALAALRPRDTWEGCRGPLSVVKTPHLNFTQKLSSAPGPPHSDFGVPVYAYRNFPRKPGLTVEKCIEGLGKVGLFSEIGIQVPDSLVMDCIRLCCSLCLLENDPEIISPDVLADDRAKFEASRDQKYIDKAHRRGKIGWDVGKHIEVIPHFRRPHMTLVWTGSGRRVPRIVPRRGSIVHREAVEKLPSGFGGG
jgi:hypothetical protein